MGSIARLFKKREDLPLVAYKEKMFRALGYGALLLLSAGLLAACGGSGHFTPAEVAAITAVQRHDNVFRIFPDRPGTISCRILEGGPVRGVETGRCTTRVSMSPRRTRLDFIEETDGASGGFTVILDKHNRIVSSSFHGSVPQMQL